MRLLTICIWAAILLPAQQQPAETPLALDDRPRFRKGQIETGTDAGAHSGAHRAEPLSVSLPVARGPLEAKLRKEHSADPNRFDPNLALGQFLLEAGRASEAIPFLESASRLDQKSVPARHDLSVALIEAGRLAESEAVLRSLQKETSVPAVVHLEARWLAASGKPVEAAEKFQQAAEAEPSETHLFDWGNHMLAHGAAEPAGKIFAWASDRFPQSARLKIAQGVSCYARGEYDRAVQMLCEGIRLDPQDIRPLAFLGQMIGVAPQREREVHRELERFARLYPEHAQAQYFYGLSLLTLNDDKAAERTLRRAARLDPKMPEPHLELGKLHENAGQTEDAIQELEMALRLSPDLSAAHYKLAQLYRRKGETQLANRHFAAYRKLRADQSAREEENRRRRIGLAATK